MQTEDKRACAACGAANRLDAASCWQCFGRLDAVIPQAPGGFGGGPQRLRPGFAPPVPEPLIAPTTGRNTSGPLTIVGVLLTIAVAAGAFLFVQRVMNRDLQLPETLAGVPQRQDAISERMQQEFDRTIGAPPEDHDVGVYGIGPIPEFLIIVAEGGPTGPTDEMFDEFFASEEQAGVRIVAEGPNAEIDGVPSRCVTLLIREMPTGTCVWYADGAGGIMFEFGGEHDTARSLLAEIWPELP